jgi:hypothetical protein
MTKNEIVEGVIELLQAHRSGARGSLHQDPYKQDFFALFAKAYNAGMMKRGSEIILYADALKDIVVARAPDLVEDPAWEILYRFWSEWTYAWDHLMDCDPLV